MGYVPGCTYDIFISYASENNHDDWVDEFERILGQELTELLGRQFNPEESIFMDMRKLRAGESFPVELSVAARGSAMLVPVLSPSYLTSEWCNRERMEFFSRLSEGAAQAECLAPILVRPIDESKLNELYRHAQRMPFLDKDRLTPLPVSSREWRALVRKFAAQLKAALEVLRLRCKPVFLGKTVGTDRAVTLRTWCSKEIQNRHFRIIPESLLTLDDPDGIRTNLQCAGMAIHFLGGVASTVLEAIETSVAVCPGPTILYQPFGAELLPDEQLWLNAFEFDLQIPPGRYQRLAQKNDQELLALVDEQIKNVSATNGKRPVKSQLAIICEEVDLEGAHKLQEELKGRGYPQVECSDFIVTRLKAMERLRKWTAYLNCADALLFYYGTGQRTALDTIRRKAENERADTPRKWFLAPPDLDSKQREFPDGLSTLDQVVAFLEDTGDDGP